MRAFSGVTPNLNRYSALQVQERVFGDVVSDANLPRSLICALAKIDVLNEIFYLEVMQNNESWTKFFCAEV
jgi:hypothetical protein